MWRRKFPQFLKFTKSARKTTLSVFMLPNPIADVLPHAIVLQFKRFPVHHTRVAGRICGPAWLRRRCRFVNRAINDVCRGSKFCAAIQGESFDFAVCAAVAVMERLMRAQTLSVIGAEGTFLVSLPTNWCRNSLRAKDQGP